MEKLNTGDLVILTSEFEESYQDIVICKVIKPITIHDLESDIDKFKLSRKSIMYCFGGCDDPIDNESYIYCPFCGNEYRYKKQSNDIYAFINWYDKLERVNDQIKHIIY